MQKKSSVSRVTPMLVKLYWIALVIFSFLAIAMCIPEIAFLLRIMQLAGGAYLGFPGPLSIAASVISFAFTNLWWVLTLIAPIVWYRQNRLWLGVTISAGLSSALLLLPMLIIKYQTNAMLAEASVNFEPIKSVQNVTSVTITSSNCNDLCERLLRGNIITTVRTLKPKDYESPHLLYRREPAQYCQKYDLLFKDDDICVVSYVDDKVRSDLIIEKKIEGRRAVKRGQIGFAPKLWMKETIKIREHKSQNIVASGVKIKWIQPNGYVPLIANTGFDGRGIHGGGLIPSQIKREGPQMDAEILLEKMGIDLASSLLFKTKRLKRFGLRPKTFRNPAPYDVALIYSMWELNGLNGKRGAPILVNWGKRFSQKGMIATKSENLLLANLLANINTIGHYNKRLVLGHVRNLLRKQTPEQNGVYEKYFLGNVRSKDKLNESVGRFNFDPQPILRDYLAKDKSPKSKSLAFLAMCRSDPRWGGKLTPLILEHALSLARIENLRQKLYILKRAFSAFEVHGQKDAWMTLKKHIAPATLVKLKLSEYDGKARCR